MFKLSLVSVAKRLYQRFERVVEKHQRVAKNEAFASFALHVALHILSDYLNFAFVIEELKAQLQSNVNIIRESCGQIRKRRRPRGVSG